jgi:carbonic anhydrase
MLGHAGYGGVGAFARGEANAGYQPLSPGEFVGKWISLIQPAAARIAPAGAPPDDYIERLALASIVQGLANLRTFPWIAERERQGKLGLHGAYFGISGGVLLAFNEVSGRFERVAAGRIAPPSPGRAHREIDPIGIVEPFFRNKPLIFI